MSDSWDSWFTSRPSRPAVPRCTGRSSSSAGRKVSAVVPRAVRRTLASRVVGDRRGCFPSSARLTWLRQRITVAMRRVVVLRWCAVLLRSVPFCYRVSTNRLVVWLPRLGISGSAAAADSAPSRSAVAVLGAAEPGSPWRRLHQSVGSAQSAPGQTVRRRACRRTWSLTSSAVAWCACGCSRASLPTGFGTREQPRFLLFEDPDGSFIGLVSATLLRLSHAACRVGRDCRRALNPRVGSGQHPADFLGCVASRRRDARALHLLVQVAFCRGNVLRRPPPISAPTALLEESRRRSSRPIRAVRRACGGDDTQRRGVATVPMMNNSHGRPAAAVRSIRRLLGCLFNRLSPSGDMISARRMYVHTFFLPNNLPNNVFRPSRREKSICERPPEGGRSQGAK